MYVCKYASMYVCTHCCPILCVAHFICSNRNNSRGHCHLIEHTCHIYTTSCLNAFFLLPLLLLPQRFIPSGQDTPPNEMKFVIYNCAEFMFLICEQVVGCDACVLVVCVKWCHGQGRNFILRGYVCMCVRMRVGIYLYFKWKNHNIKFRFLICGCVTG